MYEEREYVIHQSGATQFVDCRMNWWFRYRQRLVSVEPYLPFVAGNLLHVGMELLYSGVDIEKVVTVLKSRHKKEAGEWFIPQGKEKDWEMQLVMAIGALRYYASVAAKDIQQWEIIFPEMEFNVPILDVGADMPTQLLTNVPFRGTLDLLVRVPKGKFKGLWIVEHKYWSQITQDLLRSLPLDFQTQGYLYAANWNFSGIRGVYYNIVRKPSIKVKKNESLSEFIDRLKEDMTEREDFYFRREKVFNEKANALRFRREMTVRATEMLKCWNGEGIYRNPKACFFRGSCPYYGLCLFPNDKTQFRYFKQLPVQEGISHRRRA